MKTMVLLGGGQMGQALRNLLNANQIQLLAIGDNNPKTWRFQEPVRVMPVARALQLDPELVMIGVLDRERSGQLTDQARQLGYTGPILYLNDLYQWFDLRASALRRMTVRLEERSVPGALAELGTYRGDFAWQMNLQFPQRKFYLFDTFEGFDARDIAVEREKAQSTAQESDFQDTQLQAVLQRMPFPERIVVRKGYFPETAAGLEDERFALVSLDADLYAPTLAGLEFFYPRMSSGGVILMHDYNSRRFDGVAKAVQDYEKTHSPLPLVPLSDLHGTALILKP